MDILGDIKYLTNQYDIPENEEEVKEVQEVQVSSHTSGGTYFGDFEETNASVVVDNKTVAVDDIPTVTGFDYFVFFGLIILVILFIVSKLRKGRSQ